MEEGSISGASETADETGSRRCSRMRRYRFPLRCGAAGRPSRRCSPPRRSARSAGWPAGSSRRPGRRTVCGMLTGAGLSRIWPHDRAHWFFSRARWNPDDLGLAVARLVVSLLVPAGQPVTVAIDDTLFRRRGKKVWAASWFHDGSAPGPAKTGYGNNWVIAAIVVKLPHVSRPGGAAGAGQAGHQGHHLRLPAVAGPPHGRGWPARCPAADIHVVADAAYAGKELKKLPPRHHLDHPAAQGRRPVRPAARPRTGGAAGPAPRADRLPSLAALAAAAAFAQVTVTRYGNDRHHPGRRRHLPVVFGLRLPAGHRRADPRPLRHRLRPGPGHHRHRRDRRPGHRTVRRQMEHRGRDRRRQAGLRRRAGPQPHRPRGRAAPSRSSSPARPSPSPGTPPPATTPPTSTITAPAPPGTPPRPSPRPRT